MSTTLTPILAAAVTKDSSAGEIIAYQSVGFIIVLGSLACLAIIIAIIGKFFVKAPAQTAAPATAKSAAASTAPAAVSAEGGIPAHIVAVIAAAVAVEVGQRHQIMAVTRVGSNWSMEGRRSIYASKSYRRR